MFKRFYREDTPSYRCFISILALCGAIGINIVDRIPDIEQEFARMTNLLSQARFLLDNRTNRYLRYYTLAVKTWMQEVIDLGADDAEIGRDMYSQSRRANFTNLFRKLCMEADLDDRLRSEDQEFKKKI